MSRAVSQVFTSSEKSKTKRTVWERIALSAIYACAAALLFTGGARADMAAGGTLFAMAKTEPAKRDSGRTPISSRTESARIAREAIELLDRVPAGKRALLRALEFWNETSHDGLLRHLAYGPVSRTDAVLTRHYHPETGNEVRERYVTVILRKDQPLAEVAMDLAHELTHATTSPTWDPYDPKLTPARYMHAALEASGGEIDAVFAECEVAVGFKQDLDLRSNRCDRYLVLRGADNELAVDRGKIQSDFYRVGRWDTFVRSKLREDVALFPLLSARAPELYSATGGAPYPVALMREYEELNRVACENVRKRSRAPASLEAASLGDRCRGMRFSSVRRDESAHDAGRVKTKP
jgi:hypothetical protein